MKLFMGDKENFISSIININSIVDIFPNIKSKQIENLKKIHLISLFKVKLNPNKRVFDLIKIYELKINCHNISKYNIIGFNMAYSMLEQLVYILRIKDCLFDFQFTNTESADNTPKLQVKLHIKINLFMIFSSLFKIIKIEKRRNDESR
jgi:hypothetical protein